MSSIKIIKKGITDFDTDAIVNAANENLWEGGGVCGAIFRAAGSGPLTRACEKIGRCETGNAVITLGFNLQAKFIIHAVGPVYRGGSHNEAKLLYSSYKQSLILARENDCHSIAFPLISAGIFGYPKRDAWKKAIEACKDFLEANPDYKIEIYFAVLDDEILKLGEEVMYELMEAEAEEIAVIEEMPKDCFTFFYHEYEENGCFSQWYKSPFVLEGIIYETAEQYITAKKALLFEDFVIYKDILKEKDPKKCQELGKQIRHFDHDLWDQAKGDVAYHANLAKFSQNRKLKEALLATGDTIIAMASPSDKVWGIGLSETHQDAGTMELWKGQNLLGCILMNVREELNK